MNDALIRESYFFEPVTMTKINENKSILSSCMRAESMRVEYTIYH